jgi:signal transduction histidine kinase
MDIRTAEDKTAVVEALLNEARIEANRLRQRLEFYRRVIASTRLVMGHEFKKPTTAISGYLDLAHEDVEKAGLREALMFIDKARNECALLNDLNAFYLDLLKVDGGSGEPAVEPVDLLEIVVDAIEQTPERLHAKERVRIVVSDRLPRVSLNRYAIKLITLNLLENALKYSPEGSPVRIEAETSRDKRGAGDRDLLKLRVIDFGAGIAADDMKRVFMPFVRLDSDQVEGTGLGLTLVRNLVDMCEGEVSIRSDPGKGTTVYVTLPFTRADVGTDAVRP